MSKFKTAISFAVGCFVLIASAAAVFSIVYFGIRTGKALGFHLQLGDVGTWVGGIGAAAAALVAVAGLRQVGDLRAAEQEERQVRALRRANRILVRVVPCETDVDIPGWSVSLENKSGSAIYDVRWVKLFAMRPDPPELLEEFVCLPKRSVFPDLHPLVMDGETIEVQYLERPSGSRETHYPFPQVEFTDDEGFSFRYVVRRQFMWGGIMGIWEHKDIKSTDHPQKIRFGKLDVPKEIHPQL